MRRKEGPPPARGSRRKEKLCRCHRLFRALTPSVLHNHDGKLSTVCLISCDWGTFRSVSYALIYQYLFRGDREVVSSWTGK